MSDIERKQSLNREDNLTIEIHELPETIVKFRQQIQNALFALNDRLPPDEKMSIVGAKPELIKDVEEMRRIASEIDQKLKELEGLKFGSP